MSVLASETQNKVSSCRGALQAVEKHLEPLFAKNMPEVSRKLAPLENAELQVGLAYTVASLYFCHLLTQGVDPSEHPIRQELDRIQLYFKKLKTTAEDVRDKEAEASRTRVDAEAAKRIVQHYTSASDAASQRQVQTVSSSSGVAPQPAQPIENVSELPQRKKRKVQASAIASQDMEAGTPDSMERGGKSRESEAAPETTNAVTPSVNSTQSLSGSQCADVAANPSEAGNSGVMAEARDVATREVEVEAKQVSLVDAPVAKAPVPKVRAQVTKSNAAMPKSPSSKTSTSGVAQLCPLAAPMAPAIAARIPQDTAADTIVARAKADMQQAAVKKRKKKIQKKGATAMNATATAAVAIAEATANAAAPEVALDGEVAEDPYAVAMVDPYAS